MASDSETLALRMLCFLYDATGGRPLHWRMSAEIDRETADAIEFAVARGWVVVQGGHSICLTDPADGIALACGLAEMPVFEGIMGAAIPAGSALPRHQ